MVQPLFTQPVIALVWDFDNTLIPGSMQSPIFEKYSVDENAFWADVEEAKKRFSEESKIPAPETLYLNVMLDYVSVGRFEGLNNTSLLELGSELRFFPGLPDFFQYVRDEIESDPEFGKHNIKIEHYVVSNGLRRMILGSQIATHVEDIWGCEFIDSPPALLGTSGTLDGNVIRQVGVMLDHTTKTRALFEINKGSNKDERIDVNSAIASEDRRIPFRNMIYIADGPSDVPAFSIVNQYGGKTYAVYDPNKADNVFRQVYDLEKLRRVKSFGVADYREGSHTARWILHSAREIAESIIQSRNDALRERVSVPPSHLSVEELSRPFEDKPVVQPSDTTVDKKVSKKKSKASLRQAEKRGQLPLGKEIKPGAEKKKELPETFHRN